MVRRKSIFLAFFTLVLLGCGIGLNTRSFTFYSLVSNSSVVVPNQPTEVKIEEVIRDREIRAETSNVIKAVEKSDSSGQCGETQEEFYQYFRRLMWVDGTTGKWNFLRDRAGLSLDKRPWEEIAKAGSYSAYNVTELPITSFCERRIVFPLTTNFLLTQLRGKKLLFLGDSIARNHYVLLMARLCNFRNIDQCHTRMPTYEYDVEQDDMSIRGPMGCTPASKDPSSPNPMSACYRDGNFSYVPIAGLTMKELSVKKKALRKKAVKGGFITPAMVMKLPQNNLTLIYLSVIRPQAIEKVAAHLARRKSIHSDVDGIVVSVGPHMSSFEILYLNVTYPRAMKALRTVTQAPIVITEIYPRLEEPHESVMFVESMIDKTRRELDQIQPNPPLVVPQRHVTEKRFKLQSFVVGAADEMGEQKGCGYYDKQHPGVRCNLVLSELVLGALLAKLVRNSTNL